MNILFVEQAKAHQQLLPLTYTRPVADLRVGILTIAEKWSKALDLSTYGFLTQPYLQPAFPAVEATNATIWIADGVLPDTELTQAIKNLQENETLYLDDQLLAARGADNPFESDSYHKLTFDGAPHQIQHTWDIFRLNGAEIRKDYDMITAGRESQPITDPHTITYGKDIFLEEGAKVRAAVLNAENGPIYLGKNSEVSEGATIRGAFALGENSAVAMRGIVRGDTTLGPYCKIGGEVSNSVLWGYSNKAHDGFLGNSVIGQWCNLGAATNNSNLKNNYDPVRMWDFGSGRFAHTGLQFCGLIMGDHSKTAIGTLFNTGTTVGVAANIFGEGFPRTIIPSFSWGGASGFVTHQPRKAFITADIVMKRRKMELTDTDKAILNHIFEASAQYRVWEKNT
ncbi:GlmU family protein [Marinoscillum furvescens]|uniref:UDP-N-acetylglucosamine diphosphorylase/glucosamine-1-phosphate N-acetyltransferase n=1 Tax=Marinoscillum furvescens DSM 4134 TaxID=1122208 RepID=A0A3D9L3E2_MARFU|nr:GlmU family protein [Marinoscillum furvescens]RED98922.1 UDP-N-acetylglucosamine diphosphorylase/glucosamine-1-phosphate N-acetyltransferase [Marinoscillum furvescens DSM 4134]